MLIPTGIGPRWAGRITVAMYAWGFISAVVIMAGLAGRAVWKWVREKGGW